MATHATYPSLRGKTVLITGGAEGIGAATVELFTLQGSQVIFIDIAESSAKKTIDRAVSRAKDANVQAQAPIFYNCNVSDLPKLQDTVKSIQDKHGMIQILVNNAAAAGNRARLETEKVRPEDWEVNINNNLRHVFFMSQAVLPAMREAKSGSIINLGSITWRIPAQGTPEYGKYNIRINSVMPGAIATQRQRDEVLTPEYREEVMRGQSLQRDLEPEEVAKVIVFLGSDEASGVTGSSYVVDGATQILENIRSGNFTVEQYASSLLEQIKRRDDDVKAWAYLDPKAVLEQARALDRVPRDQRGPLHGLPVGIKDIILTKDMPTEHGSTIYKNDHPVIDAGSVMVLRQAGCLIFGKTTTTEFAASFTGPATRNAHSTGHTPGGSSAGSAAAVADFQIPIALGSQTVGSIVRPAAFNGVYGFKPTWGAITREGQKFCAPTVDTIGFFSRSVSDFEVLADVFALHDDEKSTFEDIKGSKFSVCRASKWDMAGEGTIAAMDKAVELLKAHGAEVEELDLGQDFDQVVDWHFTLVRLEGATSLWPEYCQAKDKLDPVLANGIEEKHQISRKAQLDAYDGLAALRPRFDKMADEYVAVLVPSVFDEAPEGLENTGSPVFAATWTVTICLLECLLCLRDFVIVTFSR
ncbi:amidase signature domain-containing protein [Fusarium redolens]|uniref:Amidase signature domain-containing protein n=1 Tax=Fusarium redolens TaxID=48865 RepID=A0A9P9JW92_FUSRE|nr:amidase signature domain-containing protein [Fusarium redolens]KAH7234885.1 amidase signature domain-containing protein [Fusarium redolens]